MPENIKKLIMILAIIAIIIIIILIICINTVDINQEVIIKQEEFELEAPKGTELKYEETNEFYYSVKELIEDYYTRISNLNLAKKELSETMVITEEQTDEDINELKEYVNKKSVEAQNKLYYTLGKEYIEENGITAENINTKFKDMNFKEAIIKNMYVANEEVGLYTYLVEGIAVEENSHTSNFKIMLIVDRSINCYSIYPQDYIEKNNYYDKTLGDKIEVSELKNGIEKNQYNTFKIKAISSEQKATALLENLEKTIKYNISEAIKSIDTKYAQIRFDNEDETKKYLEEKLMDMSGSYLSSYTMKEHENYKEYICKDTNGNYYIFKEAVPFKYTVQLDNYTIPTEDFAEQYNSSSDTEKVILNIKKFFMGIDDKNYGYSYSVLSEGFKNNKYPTKNDFINYAKQNFFEENEIEYMSYKKENGVYIYKIKIKDATGKDTTEKEFNMIVKLNSGTNFEMSFGQD